MTRGRELHFMFVGDALQHICVVDLWSFIVRGRKIGGGGRRELLGHCATTGMRGKVGALPGAAAVLGKESVAPRNGGGAGKQRKLGNPKT